MERNNLRKELINQRGPELDDEKSAFPDGKRLKLSDLLSRYHDLEQACPTYSPGQL